MSGFKYISKIGTEIELGSTKDRNDLKNDDSLENNFVRPVRCFGELNSPPFDNIEDLHDYIKQAYDGLVTSPKCAIQFHVSFKSLVFYEKAMEKAFFDYFIEYITKWAEDNSIRNEYFWDRLNDKNKYCRKKFMPEKQLFIKHVAGEVIEARRCILNYCWNMFKTIEFRLFPTFESCETSISAANAVVDCVESYLDRNPIEQTKEIEEEIIDGKEININIPPSVIKLNPYNFYKNRGGKVKLNSENPSVLRAHFDKKIIPDYGYFNNYKIDDIGFDLDKAMKKIQEKEIPF